MALHGAHTGIGIYAFLVQYQYWYGTLPVLALNGASTGIGIFALLSNISTGMVHYRYWHQMVPVLKM
jgi:hypothetical protein